MGVEIMSYCRICGAEMPEDAMFCMKCGTKVVQSVDSCQQPQPVYQPIPQQPANTLQPENKKSGLGFAISSMVLGIIGLIYGFIFFFIYVSVPFGATAFMFMMIFGGVSLLALIFSIIARKRGRKNGFSKTGMITGIIGISFYAFTTVVSGFNGFLEIIRQTIEYSI